MSEWNLRCSVGLSMALWRRASVRPVWGRVWASPAQRIISLRNWPGGCWLLHFYLSDCPSIWLYEFLTWGLWICGSGLEVGEFFSPLNWLGNGFICIFSGLWWKESIFHQILKRILDPEGLNCQFSKSGVIWYRTRKLNLSAPQCSKIVNQHCYFLKLNISVFLCCHR